MNRLTRILITSVAFASLCMPAARAAETPNTVIHVITLKWKEGTTEAQIKKAIEGVQTAAKMYPGIKRVWLRPLSVQGAPIGKCDTTGVTHAMVMEFESEESLKKYAGSDAQKAFYENYLPHRDQSRTHDITN